MTTPQQQIDNLASLLANATNERADALKKNTNLLGQLGEKDEQIRGLTDEVQRLTAALDDQSTRVKALEAEILELKTRPEPSLVQTITLSEPDKPKKKETK